MVDGQIEFLGQVRQAPIDFEVGEWQIWGARFGDTLPLQRR